MHKHTIIKGNSSKQSNFICLLHHFRWLSAQDLAQRPRRLVGDFSNTDPFNAGHSFGANAMAYLFVLMTTIVVIFV